jgi:hypothetical protein
MDVKASIKTISILLFSGLLVCDAYGQDVSKKFSEYRKVAVEEKIYLHTDRELYLTGETLHLSAYLVDATFNKASELSKIAYVELLDVSNVPLAQAKIDLRGGRGGGSIFLPATLSSGNYILRAYTRWMKNFNSAYFFQKSVSIVNTFVKMDPPQKMDAKVDAQFFPEGGNWIAGVEGKVGFKVTDAHGLGMLFRGALIDERNDTLLRFEPYKFGMGSFSFQPSADKTYRAVVTAGKQRQVFNLPAVNNAGYSLSARREGNMVRVEVKAHNMPASFIFLFAHARQVIAKSLPLPLVNNTAVVDININDLPEGITHLTVFDGVEKPVCERLIFKTPSKKLDLSAKADKQSYGVRKEIVLDLGASLPASASVSVFHLDSLQENPSGRIMEYLWLSSDLQGRIESPEFYFVDSEESRQAADNLMLTQGWRRFKWSDALSGPPKIDFVPENHGHLMEGVVRNPQGEISPNVLVYLSSPDKIVNTYAARSDKEGNVLYDLRYLYGSRKIVTYNDSTYRVEFANPFSTAPASWAANPLSLSTATATKLLERSVAMQVQDIYLDDRIKPINFDSLSFYGKADETYRLDDYTRFPVMEEVLREYVPGVMVRKNRDGFRFIIQNELTRKLFNDPSVLLDGVPVADVDDIMAFDPLRISKLEVVKKTFYNGLCTFPGLISFSTYDGDLAGFELDRHYMKIDYEGLNLQREVYSPRYDKQSFENVPDPRSLLYWNSNIGLRADGPTQVKFFTSDVTGGFVVVVDGLAQDGKAGSAQYQFTVKR